MEARHYAIAALAIIWVLWISRKQIKSAASGAWSLVRLQAGKMQASQWPKYAFPIVIGSILLAPDLSRLIPAVGPGPGGDDVHEAFVTLEKLWRVSQGELASKLDAGEIPDEGAATAWFDAAFKQARAQSFAKILEQEKDAFGAKKWTAKAHADYIRRYMQ